jgi:hypothetical protein
MMRDTHKALSFVGRIKLWLVRGADRICWRVFRHRWRWWCMRVSHSGWWGDKCPCKQCARVREWTEIT